MEKTPTYFQLLTELVATLESLNYYSISLMVKETSKKRIVELKEITLEEVTKAKLL